MWLTVTLESFFTKSMACMILASSVALLWKLSRISDLPSWKARKARPDSCHVLTSSTSGMRKAEPRGVIAAQGRHGVRVVGDGYSTSAGHFLEHECGFAHPWLVGNLAQVVHGLLHAVASA